MRNEYNQVGKHDKPWLVVNVGSGVSMLKLDEQMTVELPLGLS